MKLHCSVICLCGCLAGVAAGGFADDQDSCSHPELRDELAKRVDADQAARKELINAMGGSNSGVQNLSIKKLAVIGKMTKIDHENREWLKEQIDEHGWPGKSKVGKEGAHNAWLLVQHADSDRKFQERCLKLMKAEPKGEVAPVDIAYLTDRVLVARGEPQRYGTQCVMENGKAVVRDVEDRENLNARRKELGLEPIEKYLKQIEAVYQKQSVDENNDAGGSG